MGHRILSREERDALVPEAIEFVYKHIIGCCCSPDVIEKTLLHAVLAARFNQRKLDEDTLAFLFEKISESCDAMILDAGGEDLDSSYRYC
jgi:hypothetical protein